MNDDYIIINAKLCQTYQNTCHLFVKHSIVSSCPAFYCSIHQVNIRRRVVGMREERVHDWDIRAGFGVRQ